MFAMLSYGNTHSNKLICAPFPHPDFNGKCFMNALSALSHNAGGEKSIMGT